MEHGPIRDATLRDGVNFPRLFVIRHSKIPDIRSSSLLDTGRIGSRRSAP